MKGLTLLVFAMLTSLTLGCALKGAPVQSASGVYGSYDAESELRIEDIGNNVAYLPVVLDGKSNTRTAREKYMEVMDKFQQDHHVRIISWGIDKQTGGDTSLRQPCIYGLTVAFVTDQSH